MKIASVISVIVLLGILLGYVYFKLDKKPDIQGIITSEPSEPITFPNEKVISTWLWKNPYDLTDEKMSYYVNRSAEEGINTIYVDIGRYIDIVEQDNKAKVAEEVAEFDRKSVQFLRLAAEKGIKVEAMGGGADWANNDHKYLPPLLITYVHDFNSRNEYKYSGIHFDIESWNEPGFKSRKVQGYTQYLTMVDEAMKLNTELNTKHNTDLKLAFDISYWLDNENTNVPNMLWNGKVNYPLFHLLDILNREQGHKIAIMSYRNVALGKDGSAIHAKEELEFIRDNNMNIDVLIAQETSKQDIKKISFYGQSKDKLKTAANEIADYYKDFPQFKGIAIHSLESYLEL